MPFWGALVRLFSGRVKAVTGSLKDVSGTARDVTGIRKDLVETKLAEKNLAEKKILITKPTLEDVLRYDRNLERLKREWEADKARQANGADVESWLSTRRVRLITSLFVLIVLFLCLLYIVKTVLPE